MRALYGSAFRAPDFRSLYLLSPFLEGNPDLDEERVQTVELGLSGTPIDGLFTRVTLFHNALEQLIDAPPGAGRLENTGSVTSRGIELEARYEWQSGAYVSANFGYIDAKDDDGRPVPDEPRNSGSAAAWMPITERLSGGLNLYWQDQSPRAIGDSRGDLAGYQVLDANLRYRISDRIEVGIAAYNILNEDYALPAPAGTIEDDYLASGRSFRAELRLDL
jgi:outer membrane receptor protein involved in Fe transport